MAHSQYQVCSAGFLPGDVFYVGADEAIYWLQIDLGESTQVADNLEQFERLLHNEAMADEWFLPGLIEKLLQAGKVLQPYQVYSYQQPPVIGGAYSVENIEPTNIDVHFAFSGQFFEHIKDLPNGTKVRFKYKK
jgi:hypothetical protein